MVNDIRTIYGVYFKSGATHGNITGDNVGLSAIKRPRWVDIWDARPLQCTRIVAVQLCTIHQPENQLQYRNLLHGPNTSLLPHDLLQ